MNKLTTVISAASDLFKVKFLKRRIPLVVGWAITDRCNYECKYCAIWKTRVEEISTRDIYHIIDEMKNLGTKKIIFTGGEPLLRGDIGEIIDYAYRKRIFVGMNSNGSFVPDRITELKNLSYLGLSLEGPEEVHDKLRQTGSFKQVLKAVEAARLNNIKIIFNTTLNIYNFNYIDYLLGLTEQYGAQIIFQPSIDSLLGGIKVNPASPSPERYSEAIKKIIEKKRGRYSRAIRNSMVGLAHLSQWPNLKRIRCAGGLITCRIEPNGNILHCARPGNTVAPRLNCKEIGFKNAFYRLSHISCANCSCASRIEANYILRFNLSALINMCLCEINISGKQ